MLAIVMIADISFEFVDDIISFPWVHFLKLISKSQKFTLDMISDT